MRNKYIDNIDCDTAIENFKREVEFSERTETISITQALHRITGKLITARVSSPNYNASAMDGIAVRSADTMEARESNPFILEEGKEFIYVNTGAPILGEWDSVIMIEDVTELEQGRVEIIKASKPWQHIRPIGEDIIKGDPIIPAGHKIRPQDIGALISGGVLEVEVVAKPKVAIIPTGSEIVEETSHLQVGKIIDSNSHMFMGMVEEFGGEGIRYSPVKDDFDTLCETVSRAAEESDIVVINAGSSAGTKDFTVRVIEKLGRVISHGVALKPGKPTIMGVIDGKPVIGIPGYPVSSFITFDTFVKPIISHYLKRRDGRRSVVEAVLSRTIPSSLKHKEIVRVSLGYIDGELLATPLTRGAGVTMSLVKAHAFLAIPREYEGYSAGSRVEVELLTSLEEIEEQLISIGSHDIVMDLISSNLHLSSTHVGSMGGISALKRKQTHLAPIHILDEATGLYNVGVLKKYFDDSVCLIKGIEREQGIMVPKGNPKGVESIRDIAEKSLIFINRQRGAGTRILLDYLLKTQEIFSEEIVGYDREATTHMACGIAVKSGDADAALGIRAAADINGLDFISLSYEEYDFLVREEDLKDVRIEEFISFLKSDSFKGKVEALPGYRVKNSGKIIKNTV
ncbi:LysR family transcriptional regulator [Propionigenium maris DSM 9537]|uniref:Molybdopterin molybdenumtransferase n=1 Tax=Propionigenium maris DSM 9537 TaxID=1123000 RepID=A0A9W6GLX5_9FUSO|nr:molybdopterin biosynthesis protein [Propionigenium maris]GLI56833.1 LysR family transcriptional regulator [Propionigenium maris DSM 9537]